MSQLLLRTSQCIFLGDHGDCRDSSTSFTVLLASNLLAQFSRQNVIQILGLESPKVCGNLASRNTSTLALATESADHAMPSCDL
jgi:hypothetical protein